MSELAIIAPEHRNCHNHPMMTATVNGRPWMAANHLAGPLGNTERAVRKLVETLPESERAELKVPTLGGSQLTTFVSEAGALEIAVRSRSPQRLDFIRWVTTLATSPTTPTALAPSDTLAALPARVDQLAAENQTLAARVAKLEKRKKLPREMKLLSSPPQHEVDALLRAWHEQHGTEWVKLATVLPLMAKVPTLLRAGRTEAARVLRFGHLLTGLERVERHRKSDSRWVRLVAA